LVALEADVIV